MADAIVSVVLEQLASIARRHIEQEVTPSKEVKRLTNSFQAIQDVLVDADQRQVKETAVRGWLDRLKDLSYDAENVLDEWNTSKLKLQIQRAENALTLKKKASSIHRVDVKLLEIWYCHARMLKKKGKRQEEAAQGTQISKLDRMRPKEE